MFENFINELEQKLKENNIPAEEIIAKYNNRYNLGIEAGFTEEEVIKKLGSVEKIVESYLKEENKFQEKEGNFSKTMKLFSISSVNDLDVNITFIEGDKILYSMDEKLEKYYTVTFDENNFSIKCEVQKIPFNIKGFINVQIGKEIYFETFKLKGISSDWNITEGEIVADNIYLSTVSGDILIDTIKVKNNAKINFVSGDFKINILNAKNISISGVSGDIKIDKVKCQDFKANTVSGDMVVDGYIEKTYTSTISGDIVINKNKTKTMLEKLKNSFKRDR